MGAISDKYRDTTIERGDLALTMKELKPSKYQWRRNKGECSGLALRKETR
jgi:hypothetical protein